MSKGNYSFIDITGAKFGRLTVLSKSDERGPEGSVKWNCRCDCGNEVVVNGSQLRGGKIEGCGCLRGANLKRGRKPKRVLGNIRCDVVDLDDVHDLVKW